MLKRNLQKEMVVIHKDDVALAREGIEILNEKQLEEVNISIDSYLWFELKTSILTWVQSIIELNWIY